MTRQFRFPAYVNGHADGMLVEAAAGLLDDDTPEVAIRREASEELGVTIGNLQHVFDLYMSPGSVTERVHFYAAPYAPDIEVLEIPFDEALAMTADGRIADGKTVILLQWAAVTGLL